MKLFNLSLKLSGYPIKKARLFLNMIQKKSDEDFEHYISQKKQDIVNYHLKHNPFYKTFAKNANPLDWNSIPVMSKSDLQQPLKKPLVKLCPSQMSG